MDIRVLRYYLQIVREGNITSAARQLHVSQPALSRQIMDLETELEVTLFERGHRQIQLTEEGHYLYERAKEITDLVDKTEYNLQSKDIISGIINIGAGESPALGIIMDALSQIMCEYPEVRINLFSGDAEYIRQKLDNGTLEFGIVMGQQNLESYNSFPLPQNNHWGILMNSKEPLAKNKVITPTDLIGHSLITSAQTREQDTFRGWAGPLINQLNFIGNYNLIYNAALLVKTGACLAFTYDGLVKTTDVTGLTFRPLSPAIVEPNTLIWNRHRRLPNAAQLFLKLVQSKS